MQPGSAEQVTENRLQRDWIAGACPGPAPQPSPGPPPRGNVLPANAQPASLGAPTIAWGEGLHSDTDTMPQFPCPSGSGLWRPPADIALDPASCVSWAGPAL